MRAPRWTIILPVKRLPLGKSRLRPADDALVLAIALDTVVAALAVAPVLVVTSDADVRTAVAALGASCVLDAGDGLNAAVAAGDAFAGPAGPRAALLADLPALRPDELAAALDEAAGRRAFLRDSAGTGTTLLAAPAGVALAPAFGVGSAAAHLASGAAELRGAYPSVRLDVDTPADLVAARGLGLGRHTAAVSR
jgi:2-phospho-L-lactate guanylyltransferase